MNRDEFQGKGSNKRLKQTKRQEALTRQRLSASAVYVRRVMSLVKGAAAGIDPEWLADAWEIPVVQIENLLWAWHVSQEAYLNEITYLQEYGYNMDDCFVSNRTVEEC